MSLMPFWARETFHATSVGHRVSMIDMTSGRVSNFAINKAGYAASYENVAAGGSFCGKTRALWPGFRVSQIRTSDSPIMTEFSDISSVAISSIFSWPSAVSAGPSDAGKRWLQTE